MPSSVINGSPYLVDWGSSIYAKVSAQNTYGTSLYSTQGNGAVIITYPGAPTSLLSTQITTTSIQFSWTASTSTGGSAIREYLVYWDQGISSWTLRQTVDLLNTHKSTGLTTGYTYAYYVVARNAFGSSVASTGGSWLAATAPATPAPPVTSLSGSDVKISWVAPNWNGATITWYQVAILQSNGATYTTETVYCN